MHVHERNAEKKRLNGLMLKSPMKVYRAFGDIGKEVFADGALSKKHKELTALAVAVSQNICFARGPLSTSPISLRSDSRNRLRVRPLRRSSRPPSRWMT